MAYIVWGIVVLILDIMTKLIAELQLKVVGTIPLIQDIFHLTYVENRGIAFGMFSGQRWLFVIVTILVLGLLAWMYTQSSNQSRWLKWGTALVYGGALGNLLERMAKGYVVDFLDFRLIQFPVFNLADIAVCVGAACLMIHFIFFDEKPKEGDTHE
ncbi:MAG: signal peptidase II [Clostridia bacterium]|nr:signal peptidase II [Clostridia bacterium]